MPNGDTGHDSIWRAIDEFRKDAVSRNEAAARMEGRLDPILKFVEGVRDGKCPMGQAHEEAIRALKGVCDDAKPIIEGHRLWAAGRISIVVAVAAALIISLLNFASARLASATEERLRATIKEELRIAQPHARSGLDYEAPMRLNQPKSNKEK